MGNSVYNNTKTGYGASTGYGSQSGYASVNKIGTNNVNFDVGGIYPDLLCRDREGFEILRNGIDSVPFSSGSNIFTWLQPLLTSNSYDTDIHFMAYFQGSDSISDTLLPYKMFDGNNSTYGVVGLTSDSSYLMLSNPIPINITQIAFSEVYNSDTTTYALSHILISASNDNYNWVILADSSVTVGSSATINLSSNTGYYKYYRISGITSTADEYPTYASCSITANYQISTITNDKYNIFISESGSSLFETGSYYRQPALPFNIVKHGDLTEEIDFTLTSVNPEAKRINSYNFSNFSLQNYLVLPDIFNPSTSSWEMLFHIKTPKTQLQNNSTILGSGLNQSYQGISLLLHASDNKIGLYLSSNGTSWDIDATLGDTSLAVNTWYYIKVKFTGSGYSVEISTDGTTYQTTISSSWTSKVLASSKPLAIGKDLYTNSVYNGTIDLYNSYIKIGSSYFWLPIDDQTIWENTSVYPTKSKKYDSSTSIWTEYDNLYLGSVNLSNNTFSSVKSEPFNSGNIDIPNNIRPASIIDSGVITNASNFYNKSWYNLYADGWLEQGVNFDQVASGSKTFTFYKPLRDTNYNVCSSGSITGVSKNTNNIVVTHDLGTGDFIISGYISDSNIVRKYYKYYYYSYYSPNITSNGIQGVSDLIVWGTHNINNEDTWKAFHTSQGYTESYYVGNYVDETASTMYLYMQPKDLTNITGFTLYSPVLNTHSDGGPVANSILYGSNNGTSWIQLYSTGSFSPDVQQTFTFTNSNYYKYYKYQITTVGTAHKDQVNISSLHLTGTYRVALESTSSDYDFYVDVEG